MPTSLSTYGEARAAEALLRFGLAEPEDVEAEVVGLSEAGEPAARPVEPVGGYTYTTITEAIPLEVSPRATCFWLMRSEPSGARANRWFLTSDGAFNRYTGVAQAGGEVVAVGYGSSGTADVIQPRKRLGLGQTIGWLDVVYKRPEVLKDREIAEVIRGVSDLLNRGEYDTVDLILQAVDPHRASVEVVLALLRTSYPARGALKSWDGLVERAAAEVAARGRQPQRVLRGLLAAE